MYMSFFVMLLILSYNGVCPTESDETCGHVVRFLEMENKYSLREIAKKFKIEYSTMFKNTQCHAKE